jgi:hypothetical protein
MYVGNCHRFVKNGTLSLGRVIPGRSDLEICCGD